MLVNKDRFPQEGELVLCTVTRIQYHSVLVELDEYKRTAMIHISEISPGRIRNIRDYVKEGKKIVCVVLRIHKDRNHIEVSLRRVSENQRRNKVNEIKQEQIAEKIVEFIAKKLKKDYKPLLRSIQESVSKKYESLYECFEDALADDKLLAGLGIENSLAKELNEVISQRIKPHEVEIKSEIRLESYRPDGVDIIKQALRQGIDAAKSNIKSIDIVFAGGGRYILSIISEDYKPAEAALKKATEAITAFIEKNDGTAEFKRIYD